MNHSTPTFPLVLNVMQNMTNFDCCKQFWLRVALELRFYLHLSDWRNPWSTLHLHPPFHYSMNKNVYNVFVLLFTYISTWFWKWWQENKYVHITEKVNCKQQTKIQTILHPSISFSFLFSSKNLCLFFRQIQQLHFFQVLRTNNNHTYLQKQSIQRNMQYSTNLNITFHVVIKQFWRRPSTCTIDVNPTRSPSYFRQDKSRSNSW